MIWMDYVIEQAGPHFRVKGDWLGEVMGWTKDGKKNGVKKLFFTNQVMFLL